MTDSQSALSVDFTIPENNESHQALIIPVFDGNIIGSATRNVDTPLTRIITRNLDAASKHDIYVSPDASLSPKFEGKMAQAFVFPGNRRIDYEKVVLLGMGPASSFDTKAAQDIGKHLKKVMVKADIKDALLLADQSYESEESEQNLYCSLASGAYEAFYSFDKYKSDDTERSKSRRLNIAIENSAEMKAAFAKAATLSNAKMWAQDLGNEPPNKLYPASYAREIREKLKPLGVDVTIIDYEEMQKQNMHAALAVGGSAKNKPCMVVMEWDGTDGQVSSPVGLVGKGVTIDTGGYNIKTAAMEKMKMDMGGSAAVVGCMRALAEQQSRTKVVAVVGLVENRVTGDSYLPGDIIDSLSGKTIEIGNTDAEGRLVMADAITYLQHNYSPHTITDIATLTGSAIQAFGHDKAPVFSNDESVSESFEAAALGSGEAIVCVEIEQKHHDSMRGQFADLSNTGSLRDDGHITAAAFLENFVEGNTKWAHIDIAGTFISQNGTASGYGVKLLAQWINDNYSEDLGLAQQLPHSTGPE